MAIITPGIRWENTALGIEFELALKMIYFYHIDSTGSEELKKISDIRLLGTI